MKKPRPEDLIGYILFAIALILIAVSVLFVAFDYSEKMHNEEVRHKHL
jgi:hypothetical protein